MADKPELVVQRISESFMQAWETGTHLPVEALAYPAHCLQAGVLHFAAKAKLQPMQERELVQRCLLRLHPAFASLVSMTLLTQHGIVEELQHLREFMVISTHVHTRVERTPALQILPADQVALACLRVWEYSNDFELRWTWSGVTMHDGQLTWEGGDRRAQRDLRKIPGITPMRKVAGDRLYAGPQPSEERIASWQASPGYKARQQLRQTWGIFSANFVEAWGARLDLENTVEMQQAIAAVRAMRAYAASRLIMGELGMLATRTKTSVSELMLNPNIGLSQAARVQSLLTQYEALQLQFHTGSLCLPDIFLRYMKGHTPHFLHPHLEEDAFHHEAKRCSPAVLHKLQDKAASALQQATVMVDLHDAIADVGKWIGLDKPIRFASFRPDAGDWEVKFDGVDDPQIVSDSDFQRCRWAVLPQIIDRSRKLQLSDFEISSKGVLYNLGRWRFTKWKSNTQAQQISHSG